MENFKCCERKNKLQRNGNLASYQQQQMTENSRIVSSNADRK